MLDHHPIRSLALKLFTERLGDLLSIRAKSTFFEQSIIEGTYELLWYQRTPKSEHIDEWEKTVRAAFSILDRGFLISQQRVAKSFVKIANHIIPALLQSFDMRAEAERVTNDNEDIKIQRYLAFYKTMYEGLLRVIMAPIVFSYSIANNVSDNSFVPGSDGRINLNAIKKMEGWRLKPQSRLSIGLNNHVRNAYSHERYRILDNGKVELWDIKNRRGDISWGPETWTVDDLCDLCDKLWINALAIVCALAIFSINTSDFIRARGWDSVLPPSPPLRKADFERLVREFADKLNFDVIELVRSEINLKIRLSTRLKGIDQNEEFYVVGGNRPRRFKMRVKYVESKVIAELLDFLVLLRQYFDGIKEIEISVQDPDKQYLGEVIIEVDHLTQLQGPSKQSIEEARKLCRIDTLGDSIMYRRMEGVPREE